MVVPCRGIDVSHWQGVVDWPQVAKHCKFVILKAGGSDAGFYKDSRFEYNYMKAREAGLAVGAYYFVGKRCTSAEAGRMDADRFANLLKGKQFDMPVYLDFEAPSTRDKKGNTDAAVAFCNRMEDLGYFVGIYASDIAGFADRLILSRCEPYTLWVARYGSTPKYVKRYGIHQSSEKGRMKGIDGYVDLNTCYRDFPTIIKLYGFNGYKEVKKNEHC